MDDQKLKKVNITDPDAKIMKHKDGSMKPSYNCQVNFMILAKAKKIVPNI